MINLYVYFKVCFPSICFVLVLIIFYQSVSDSGAPLLAVRLAAKNTILVQI